MSCASSVQGQTTERAVIAPLLYDLFPARGYSAAYRATRPHFHCKSWPLVAMSNYIFIYSRFSHSLEIPRISLKTLVSRAGLEPATLCLKGGIRHSQKVPCFQIFMFQ